MTPAIKALLNEIAGMIRSYPELEDDATLRADMIEGATDLNEVIDALVDGAASDREMALARKARAAQLEMKAQADEARADKKREMVAMLMECASIKKMCVPSGTVTLVYGKARPKVDNVDELPQGFFSIVEKRKADLDAIKAAFEAGDAIPGVSVSPAKNHIQVR